jgi:hypothetical protein
MMNSFEYGMMIGAAEREVSPSLVTAMSARDRVMSSKEAVPFNRELCKIAATAFELDGDPAHPAGILFSNLAKTDVWHSSYNEFSDMVKKAMAKNDYFSKSAMFPMAIAAHSGIGNNLLRTLTAAGVIGGAGVGALGYIMSRNARQSSAESRQLLEKIRAYKQLRRDIEEDMKEKGEDEE